MRLTTAFGATTIAATPVAATPIAAVPIAATAIADSTRPRLTSHHARAGRERRCSIRATTTWRLTLGVMTSPSNPLSVALSPPSPGASVPAPAVPSPRRVPLEDSRLLAQYAATQDRRLRDALVERFMPLARSIALRYARGGEPLDDLVQVASLGLLKALERFDPERGVAFSSYAVPTIAGEIRRHLRDRCWTVRPPRALSDTLAQLARTTEELRSRLGRAPTIREIGQALELTDEAVLEVLQARHDL